jgi:methyl-accepting chemotaxis protein
MFGSLTRTTLAAGIALMMLVLLSGGVGIRGVTKLIDALAESHRLQEIGHAHMQADMAHDAIRGDVLMALAARDPANEISFQDVRDGLNDHVSSMRKHVEDERKLASPAERDVINALDAPISDYIAAANQMIDAAETNPDMLPMRLGQFNKQFKRLELAMLAVSEKVDAITTEIDNKAKSTGKLSKTVMIGTIIFCILAVGLLWYAVRRYLVSPLLAMGETTNAFANADYSATIPATERADEIGVIARALGTLRQAGLDKIALEQANEERAATQAEVVAALGEALKRLSAGDVSRGIEQRFPPSYEQLRNDFNEAIEGLGQALASVADASQSIRTGSNEIAAASDDLSRRTEQQAASLEEAAAAMDQLTNSIRETAKGAAHAAESVRDAHNDASEGGRVVGEAVSAMDGIEKSSQEIAQIINVIDGIAFQTNLLALNAGVEAARAGDAGKGFAVVANEVRALAQRSADAAKDIKALITESSRQVESGVRLVGQTGDALGRIVTRIGEINGLVRQIAETADEQAAGITQVNAVVNDMDKMTQQNAAMVEQSTAAGRSLVGHADALSTMLTEFQLDAAGASRSYHASAAPRAAAKRMPARPVAVQGNLAMASDDDWTDF